MSMRQAGEQSVEEILESIKKVIARDNRAGADDERRQRESNGIREAMEAMTSTPQPDEADEDGILDLAESEEISGSDYELHDEHDDDTDDAGPIANDQPLVTDHARIAMRESLAALAVMAAPGVAPRIVRSGETSLEDLARELLRPAISDWLEANLPAMVERMVASEIARIVVKK